MNLPEKGALQKTRLPPWLKLWALELLALECQHRLPRVQRVQAGPAAHSHNSDAQNRTSLGVPALRVPLFVGGFEGKPQGKPPSPPPPLGKKKIVPPPPRPGKKKNFWMVPSLPRQGSEAWEVDFKQGLPGTGIRFCDTKRTSMASQLTHSWGIFPRITEVMKFKKQETLVQHNPDPL